MSYNITLNKKHDCIKSEFLGKASNRCPLWTKQERKTGVTNNGKRTQVKVTLTTDACAMKEWEMLWSRSLNEDCGNMFSDQPSSMWIVKLWKIKLQISLEYVYILSKA